MDKCNILSYNWVKLGKNCSKEIILQSEHHCDTFLQNILMCSAV